RGPAGLPPGAGPSTGTANWYRWANIPTTALSTVRPATATQDHAFAWLPVARFTATPKPAETVAEQSAHSQGALPMPLTIASRAPLRTCAVNRLSAGSAPPPSAVARQHPKI